MTDDVRIVRGDFAPAREKRTAQQERMDEILSHATAHADTALENVTEALGWLSLLKTPDNPTLPVRVQQLVEEIKETKRLRG